MSYAISNSRMRDRASDRQREKDRKREMELRDRAKRDPEVHKQLVQLMEEDEDLVNMFSKHLQRNLGSKWDKLSHEEKTNLVKKAMEKNRVPRNSLSKGGKSKKRAKKNKNNNKTKKNKTNQKKTKKNKTKSK